MVGRALSSTIQNSIPSLKAYNDIYVVRSTDFATSGGLIKITVGLSIRSSEKPYEIACNENIFFLYPQWSN